ncbi:MAG: glycoside hydrolase family 38 C-terminal domain-containing protein [Chthonomonadales bacterium]
MEASFLVCLVPAVLVYAQTPPQRQSAFLDLGPSATRDAAVRLFHTRLVPPSHALNGVKVLWIHWDAPEPPAAAAALIASIRRFVEEGGGLLLTGPALCMLNDLGVEPIHPRYLPPGEDAIGVGFLPLLPCRAHPLFAGFTESAPMVASSGFPAICDFYGTGGPKGGIVLAKAVPDAGENPIVEYRLGRGRILAIGWRLPDFRPVSNAYASSRNLLIRNALSYLASGKWFNLRKVEEWNQRTLSMFLVPNSHGTICGWLVPWTAERRKVVEVLQHHLNYLRAEPSYRFALSEVPNIISARDLLPPRDWQYLLSQIKLGRVELVNSFFLEPDTNLADGEALCQMAIQGVRWQRDVMGHTPSTCWMIDAVGMHSQMPQIVRKTGIASIVFTRGNRCGSELFQWEAPDGSRVVAAHWPYYAYFGQPDSPGALFDAKITEEAAQRALEATSQAAAAAAPGDRALIPIGSGDYSEPPARPGFMEDALARWNRTHPTRPMEISTPGPFFRSVVGDGRAMAALPVYRGELDYSWPAFDINMPFVKQRFRAAEHLVTEAEKAATLANMAGMAYPAQQLLNCWYLLLLNMDRNTLWGAAIEEVFRGAEWNATDRFDAVEHAASEVLQKSLTFLGHRCSSDAGHRALLLFNPLSWRRAALQIVDLPAGTRGWRLQDAHGREIPVQLLEGPGHSRLAIKVSLPALGYRLLRIDPTELHAQPFVHATEWRFTTRFYTLTLDPATGAIQSLTNTGGHELLAGPSNVLTEETGADEHFPKPRNQRSVTATSSDGPAPRIRVRRGPLATEIRIEGRLGSSLVVRNLILYKDIPRIDCSTELDWRGSSRIVAIRFRIGGNVTTACGIPYGQVQRGDGFFPTVGWSDHSAGAGGLALLDRGIPNREIYGHDIALLVLNSVPQYMGHPCPSLAGNGKQVFEYALIPHGPEWKAWRTAAASWEFEEAPVAQEAAPSGTEPWQRTYGDTGPRVILSALRREGDHTVVRLVNLDDRPASGLRLRFRHGSVGVTNLLGEAISEADVPSQLMPQEIRTLKVAAGIGAARTTPLRSWSELTDKLK